MKKKSVNSKVVQGDFFGGDIEPGTFHTKNVANGSGHCSELPVLEDVCEDLEAITADTDTLTNVV